MTFSAFSFGNWFTDLFDSTPTPTIKIPIDLSKKGTVVDTVFRVNYDESTYFSLDFYYDNPKFDNKLDSNKVIKFLGFNGYLYGEGKQISIADYEEAKRSLGDMINKNYDLDGTKVPLKISLMQLYADGTQKKIIDKVFETKGENGGGYKHGRHRDITVKHLKKGKYKLTIENLKDFKELAHRPMKLRIQSTYRK